MIFKVGDEVQLKRRNLDPRYFGYGKVILLYPDFNEARVRLYTTKSPETPGICDKCKGENVMLRDFTGDIICLRMECSFNHGLVSRDEVISTTELVNITEKFHNQEKEKLRTGINGLLDLGVEKGLVTADQVLNILQILDNVNII